MRAYHVYVHAQPLAQEAPWRQMSCAVCVVIDRVMHAHIHTGTELNHILHSYRKLGQAELKVATAGRDVAQADLRVLEAKNAPRSEIAEAER